MSEAERRAAETGMLSELGAPINPASRNPEPTAEMARRLHAMLETAKRDGTIDAAMNFLFSKLDRTIEDLGSWPLACAKGCTHCCHAWVSATAPELLVIAKLVRRSGDHAIARLRAAHEQTKDLSPEARLRQPTPCPLLEQGACSVYDSRPKSCRFAVSGDASICARVFHHLSNEGIPTPTVYVDTRNIVALAMAIALKRSSLPHHAYELIAGLVRALDVPDAERAWLAGEDIFAGVARAPGDVLAQVDAPLLFKHAFGPN